MKIIAFVSLATIFLAGYFVFLQGENEKKETTLIGSGGNLTVLENDFDFGDIELRGGNVSHKFEVKNKGSEAMMVKKVYTSCMCTTAYLSDASGKRYGKFGMQGHKGLDLDTDIKIAPGEKAEVEVIFDPFAHGPNGTGKIKRIVYLETSSEKTPKVEIKFTGNVIE